MNKKCKLIKCLLDGDIINVANSIRLTGYSNPSREVARCVEIPFGVVVEKILIESKDVHGNYVCWKNYKLLRTRQSNKDGIEKMKIYLAENMKEYRPKEKPKPLQSQSDLFA